MRIVKMKTRECEIVVGMVEVEIYYIVSSSLRLSAREAVAFD